MNERIWKLQGQAKVLAEEIVSKRKYDDYMEYKQCLMDKTMDVFAELIVKEVFAKIEDERFEVYQPVKESVMKHFGVEE